MHDRTGEAELHLCAQCEKNWANVETEDALICAACWTRNEKEHAPVKEARRTEL